MPSPLPNPGSNDGRKRAVFVEPCEGPDAQAMVRAVVWDDSGEKREVEHLFETLADALTFAHAFCPTPDERHLLDPAG